ncbi:MAG: hypothetical protein ACI8PZ_003212 [Myxococcota bacterium]|jgi:hypothetical protein
MTVEALVAVLRGLARAGAVGWTPAAEAGPAPKKTPPTLAPLLAAGRPHLEATAFGDPLTVPLDFRGLAQSTGEALITPANRAAPGWQVGSGDAVWHRLEVHGRTLWIGPGGIPVAASDGDLLLLALLGLTDLLLGHGTADSLAQGGLWGEPLHAARLALGRLESALDDLRGWPDWIHPTRPTVSDPTRRVLVLTPAHVPGGEAELATLGRHAWSDTPFLFYTRAHKEHLRAVTRDELPSQRPPEDKEAARGIGAWLVRTLEEPIISNLAFPDGELRVYKKQLFGHGTPDAFRVLRAHDYHPVLLGPEGLTAFSLRDGADETRSRLPAAAAVLSRCDRDAPAEIAPPTPLPRSEGQGPPPPKVDGGRPSLRLAWAAVAPGDLHSSWSFGLAQPEDAVPGAHMRANDHGVVALTLRANAAFLPLVAPWTGIEIRLGVGPEAPGEVKLVLVDDVRQRGWDARLQCHRSLRLRPFHDVEHGPTSAHQEWHRASKLGGVPSFLSDEITLSPRFQFVGQLTDDLFDALVGSCVYIYADPAAMEYQLVWQRE